MVCWGRWRTINGKPVCIKDPLAKPFIFLTVALSVLVTAGGTAVTATSIGTVTAEAAISPNLSVRVTNSRSAARRGQVTEAWRRMGLRAVTRAAGRETRRELGCTATSSGQVGQFFGRTPCQSMQRTQPVLCDAEGNTITVSITWVRMPTAVSAERLKRLVDRDGAGSVSASDGVRFTGKHYASRRTGPLVVITETAPAGKWPSADMLDGVAEVAAEFPEP